MMNFTHMLTGAAIASKLNPALGLPLAFASHFVIDAIPHNDGIYETAYQDRPPSIALYLQLVLDFALGIIVLSRTTDGYPNQSYLALAALAGIMPDILTGLYLTLPKFTPLMRSWWKPLHDFHGSIQYTKIPWWMGFLINIIISMIAVTVILL